MRLHSKFLRAAAAVASSLVLNAPAPAPADVNPAQQEARAELASKKARSAFLLRNIVPLARLPQGGAGTAKVMESEDGSVRWGHLFGLSEACALVSIPFKQPSDLEEKVDPYPADSLLYYTWSKGRWTYRQFLGAASNLSLHRHRSIVYLQASERTGRHDGDHFSWRLDPAHRRLVRTRLEQWGPVYFAGPYVVRTRGFERLAHWETHWIYPNIHGHTGTLLACFHQDDARRFAVTFRDAPNGQLRTWAFRSESEDSDRYFISAEGTRDDLAYAGDKFDATVTVLRDDKGRFPEYCFQLLTGLNPCLLEEKWRDDLPKPPPLPPVKIKVTGNAAMVARLQSAHRSANP